MTAAAAHQARERQNPPPATIWRAVLSTFCASLVGIGLARFAHTPLLPGVVDAHWFEASAAVNLDAANLAGYLAGALLGRPISSRMMLAAAAAVFCLRYTNRFIWFFAWRFASGFAGQDYAGYIRAPIRCAP